MRKGREGGKRKKEVEEERGRKREIIKIEKRLKGRRSAWKDRA